MKKHFYSHIVQTDSLHVSLSELDLTQEEREELVSIANDTLHHVILDAVLSELSEDDKKQFLSLLLSEKHEDIWKLLNAKVENIEGKIQIAAEEVKNKLHEDIKDAKSK